MKNVAQNKDRNKEGTRRVPALRFSEFSGDSAGVSKAGSSRVSDAAAVGLEWEELKLGDLLTFKNGVNAAKEKYGRGHRFINVLDIIENDYLTHERIRGSVDISDADFEKNKVEYGDILFQRSSETREEVGQANVYLDKRIPATFGGFVIMGKKIGNYDPTFLNYLLRTSSVREDMTSRSGGSTRYNIGQDSLKKVPIVIPKEPEQKKIAGFLGAVDEWIGILREEKSVLETYKRGVMQRLFASPTARGGVVSLRVEGVGDSARGKVRRMPEGVPSTRVEGVEDLRFRDDNGNDFPDWEEKKLGEVLEIGNGRDYKHLKKGDVPVFGTGGYMLSVNEKLGSGETVFIGRKGTINKPFYYKGDFWTVDTLFYTHSYKGAIPKFITLLFNHINWLKYNEASGIPSLSKKTIEKIKIGLPSLPEQKKIADFLTALDEIITDKADEITKAEEWKKGLMQKMFV